LVYALALSAETFVGVGDAYGDSVGATSVPLEGRFFDTSVGGNPYGDSSFGLGGGEAEGWDQASREVGSSVAGGWESWSHFDSEAMLEVAERLWRLWFLDGAAVV
jgi:hypothetical protein